MTFLYAFVLDSARNMSTSAAVGGSPVKSNVARRISVRLSAGAAGARFFSSSFAKINGSIAP